MKKLFSLMLIFVFFVVTTGCGQSATPPADKKTEAKAPEVKVPGVTADTITLGGVTDFSGPLAPNTTVYAQGIKDYYSMVNDSGGINGRKVVLKWEDDQYKTEKTLAGFRKLVDEGAFAIIAQLGSAAYVAMEPDIKELKVPMWPAQTMALQQNPYTFSMMLGYTDMGKIIAKNLVQSYKGPGKPKIGIMLMAGASAKELGQATKTEAEAQGATVFLYEEAVAADVSEFSAQITKLKAAGANAVFGNFAIKQTVAFMRDAKALGMSDMQVISGYGTLDPTMYETIGKENSKNLSTIHPFVPSSGTGAGIDEMKAAAAKYGTPPATVGSMNYVQGWISAKLQVEGLKRAGKNLTRESYLKALEGISNFDTGGLSGTVTFTPTQHFGITSARFYGYDFEKKQIVPKSDWLKS